MSEIIEPQAEKIGAPLPPENTPASRTEGAVTARAFMLGLLLTIGLAWLNCWIETIFSVHFVGGIQIPFGSVFVLLVLVLAVNWPLRALGRLRVLARVFPPFSSIELMTIYVMLLFAALVSTPGCDNQFMTVGPTLFYFSTPENGWADLFYRNVPRWFAPGWNGLRYRRDVIDPLYVGGLDFRHVPWHAWMVMLVAWSVFLLLVYALLFFVSLMFRKQWLRSEALAFPLVELPLQMAETDDASTRPPARAFWGNRTMWLGFGVAAALHFMKGLNTYYPDWPMIPVNEFRGVAFSFTERPWSAMPSMAAFLHLGAIGVAFLLTREVSFSFWFFYLLLGFEHVLCEMLGYPIMGFDKIGLTAKPAFMVYQSIGSWVMMALLMVWTARDHLWNLIREALGGRIGTAGQHEPFSPRFIITGFAVSLLGLLGWCSFAGINVFYGAVFLSIFLLSSLVIARLVIEGGLFFPQAPYYPLEWMTTGMFGFQALGASNLTRLAFMQQVLMTDTRTNLLPAFLHTMKIADTLKLDRRGQRRLLTCAGIAIIVTLFVTYATTLQALYSKGGLTTDVWFTYAGPTVTLNRTATAIKTQPPFQAANVAWIGVGAITVWLLVLCRSRFLWFPLHPLGLLPALTYPMTELWFPFFLGWMIKSLVLRFGGQEAHLKVRPFMIGLILGNLSAVMFWMMVGFRTGVQIPYWPG